MLYFCDVGLSHAEVPGETTLCFYISGCINRCKNCHFPELQFAEYGDRLSLEVFTKLVELYSPYETCICFMGEGNCTAETRNEMVQYTSIVHKRGYKCCLYSGRDTVIEEWMQVFDYIKIGAYKEKLGPLYSNTTNQRLYKKNQRTYEDITAVFWEDNEELAL